MRPAEQPAAGEEASSGSRRRTYCLEPVCKLAELGSVHGSEVENPGWKVFSVPPLAPLASLLVLPPPPAPCLPSSRGAEAAGAGTPWRRVPVASGARRSGAARSGQGRGGGGPPAPARRRGAEGAGSSHLRQRKALPGETGAGGCAAPPEAALPGSAAEAGAWRRGEAAAAAPDVSLSISPSPAGTSSGRRASPQRAEKRLLVALSHRGKGSPFWGCPRFRIWCVCARVCACLPVWLRGAPVPGLCIPNITTPPRLRHPSPSPPPRQTKVAGLSSGSGAGDLSLIHI